MKTIDYLQQMERNIGGRLDEIHTELTILNGHVRTNTERSIRNETRIEAFGSRAGKITIIGTGSLGVGGIAFAVLKALGWL